MITYHAVLLHAFLCLLVLFTDVKANTSRTNDTATLELEQERVCPKPRLLHEFSKQKVTGKESLAIVRGFIKKYSLSLVIGTCRHFPYWAENLYCNKNMRIYIYFKCIGKIPQLTEGNPGISCFWQIYLLSQRYSGMGGTIKYHLYNNYNNLTNYTLFIKDNNRKSAGLSTLQKIGSALLNVKFHGNTIRFMSLSDVPPSYHSIVRIHSEKTRSVRRSISFLDEKMLQSLRRNSTSPISKYCRLFEYFTCTACKSVWIPIRSQFLVSADAVQQIDRDEFNIMTSEHYEYTWAILFNCFREKLKKGRYPFFACAT